MQACHDLCFSCQIPRLSILFSRNNFSVEKRAYIFAQFFAPRLHLIMKITRARRCQVNWIFKLCIKNETDFFLKIPLLFLTASLKRRLFLCQTFFVKKQCCQLWLFDYHIGVFTIKIYKTWPANSWSQEELGTLKNSSVCWKKK